MAEHFVQPPQWTWFIILYFFAAGLAGGSYTLATILRWRGTARDEGLARVGFKLAFPLVVICGILLTIDLGQPLRFWHMMIDTTPGASGLNFKYWSPISLGSWALLAFGLFSFVSFLFAWRQDRDGRAAAPTSGGIRIWNLLGSVLGLFLASYTGVVLSVSNQWVWSDSWVIGALFVASGLSASAALLAWLGRSRADASAEARLAVADGYFALLELVALIAFFVTLAVAGSLMHTLRGVYWILWILVVVSLIPPLRSLGSGRARLGSDGSAAMAQSSIIMPLVVLVGVLLMRVAVILSAQY
jgi:formate-dependent nitrite reductase membrane component NrfD